MISDGKKDFLSFSHFWLQEIVIVIITSLAQLSLGL